MTKVGSLAFLSLYITIIRKDGEGDAFWYLQSAVYEHHCLKVCLLPFLLTYLIVLITINCKNGNFEMYQSKANLSFLVKVVNSLRPMTLSGKAGCTQQRGL